MCIYIHRYYMVSSKVMARVWFYSITRTHIAMRTYMHAYYCLASSSIAWLSYLGGYGTALHLVG
jgi:hypothetical protein